MACVFCEKLLPSNHEVLELPATKTFLPHKKRIPGHVLVIHKKHVEDESLLTPHEREQFFQDAVIVGKIVKKIYAARRINYLLLGNEIPHLHWHVIPRSVQSIKKSYFPVDFLKEAEIMSDKEVELESKKLKKKFEETIKTTLARKKKS